MTKLYLQENQPEGVPPLQLTGERTLPDVPEENYWFRRHLVVYEWIASVGVDPAPYFRRMYNPATQQERHDPDGAYVRRWVPELRDVPLERLAQPWTMSEGQQEAAGCVIGRDYPEPIVDHKDERERAMARYRAVRGGG